MRTRLPTALYTLWSRKGSENRQVALDEVMGVGVSRRRRAGGQVELAEDGREVALDCGDADEKHLGNLAIGAPCGNQAENL